MNRPQTVFSFLRPGKNRKTKHRCANSHTLLVHQSRADVPVGPAPPVARDRLGGRPDRVPAAALQHLLDVPPLEQADHRHVPQGLLLHDRPILRIHALVVLVELVELEGAERVHPARAEDRDGMGARDAGDLLAALLRLAVPPGGPVAEYQEEDREDRDADGI